MTWKVRQGINAYTLWNVSLGTPIEEAIACLHKVKFGQGTCELLKHGKRWQIRTMLATFSHL